MKQVLEFNLEDPTDLDKSIIYNHAMEMQNVLFQLLANEKRKLTRELESNEEDIGDLEVLDKVFERINQLIINNNIQHLF